MEQVLRGLQNVLIYINEVLIHTDTHEKLLEALGQVLVRLHLNHLKIILYKYLPFWGQSSVLPRIHTHSSMSQTRESQALGHWRCRHSYRCEIHSFIRGLVQLLSKPHSQLRDHSSTLIPTHPPRVWIYFRSANGFRNPPESTLPRTNPGFPQKGQKIRTNNQRLPTNYLEVSVLLWFNFLALILVSGSVLCYGRFC